MPRSAQTPTNEGRTPGSPLTVRRKSDSDLDPTTQFQMEVLDRLSNYRAAIEQLQVEVTITLTDVADQLRELRLTQLRQGEELKAQRLLVSDALTASGPC